MGVALLGIRTHDNERSIWFSTYPEGEQAYVAPGVNNLTINIGVTNTNTIPDIVGCSLIRGDGVTLIDYGAITNPGDFHNFEITTDMLDADTGFSVYGWYYDEYGNYIWVRLHNFSVLRYSVIPPTPPVPPTPPPQENGGINPLWIAAGIAIAVVGIGAVWFIFGRK